MVWFHSKILKVKTWYQNGSTAIIKGVMSKLRKIGCGVIFAERSGSESCVLAIPYLFLKLVSRLQKYEHLCNHCSLLFKLIYLFLHRRSSTWRKQLLQKKNIYYLTMFSYFILITVILFINNISFFSFFFGECSFHSRTIYTHSLFYWESIQKNRHIFLSDFFLVIGSEGFQVWFKMYTRQALCNILKSPNRNA